MCAFTPESQILCLPNPDSTIMVYSWSCRQWKAALLLATEVSGSLRKRQEAKRCPEALLAQFNILEPSIDWEEEKINWTE